MLTDFINKRDSYRHKTERERERRKRDYKITKMQGHQETKRDDITVI